MSSKTHTPLRVVFSTLFSVFGYPDETQCLVFDILLEECFRKSLYGLVWTVDDRPNRRNKAVFFQMPPEHCGRHLRILLFFSRVVWGLLVPPALWVAKEER